MQHWVHATGARGHPPPTRVGKAAWACVEATGGRRRALVAGSPVAPTVPAASIAAPGKPWQPDRATKSAPCRFTPRRVPLLRDETESMTNPTRRIRAHGRLFSSHGNRTRDQLRDPRAVEKVALVNRKLIPPRCLTVWCFRRSMDKRGHCSVLIIGWSAQPASVVSTVLSHRPGRSRPMSTSSVV